MTLKDASNPWVARFGTTPTVDEIRRRVMVVAVQQDDLMGWSPVEASNKLLDSIGSIYVPTTRCCEILQQMFEIVTAHSRKTYTDKFSFINTIFRSNNQLSKPSDHDYWPYCITGPSGVGKSALLSAFRRLLPEDSNILVNDLYPPFRMKAAWHISLEENRTVARALLNLNSTEEKMKGISADSVLIQARRIAFRDGVCAITADEFQNLSRSTNANALATSALYDLRQLSIPAFYGVNYSLVHKLLNRNAEDKTRLVLDPIILLPESYGEGWNEYVAEIKKVSPVALNFEPEVIGRDLYRYSAGLRRLAKYLVYFAYRDARIAGRSSICEQDIRAAYLSPAYHAVRGDVEIMLRQALTNSCEKKDLWCPFDMSMSSHAQLAEEARIDRDARSAEAALLSSLTAEEREGLRILRAEQSQMDERRHKKEQDQGRSTKKPTAEALLQATGQYLDEIGRLRNNRRDN